MYLKNSIIHLRTVPRESYSTFRFLFMGENQKIILQISSEFKEVPPQPSRATW